MSRRHTEPFGETSDTESNGAVEPKRDCNEATSNLHRISSVSLSWSGMHVFDTILRLLTGEFGLDITYRCVSMDRKLDSKATGMLRLSVPRARCFSFLMLRFQTAIRIEVLTLLALVLPDSVLRLLIRRLAEEFCVVRT